MDMDLLVGVVFVLLLTMIVAGVVLLFPISRKVGQLIDLRVAERKRGMAEDGGQAPALLARLSTLEEQVDRLRERQEFTEQLLAQPETPGTLASERRPEE